MGNLTLGGGLYAQDFVYRLGLGLGCNGLGLGV